MEITSWWTTKTLASVHQVHKLDLENGVSMSETEYKAVRGLMRGLALINGLNRFDGGATTAQLAEQSGLHRTTVRRLLETLQAEGVRRSESDDSYRLTLKVRD
jgi:IclR family mhp operon transcriptional activator